MKASGKDIKSIGDRILAFEGALTAKDVSKLLNIDTDTICPGGEDDMRKCRSVLCLWRDSRDTEETLQSPIPLP